MIEPMGISCHASDYYSSQDSSWVRLLMTFVSQLLLPALGNSAARRKLTDQCQLDFFMSSDQSQQQGLKTNGNQPVLKLRISCVLKHLHSLKKCSLKWEEEYS